MNKTLDYIFPNPQGLDPAALDPRAIPEHVAVIMDGNGRWAKKRALNRLKGHKAGIEAVRETIRCASDLGVRYLTIYSFSTENWKRPQEEVVGLMDLFAKTMLAEVDGLHEENVRVRTIGDLSALPRRNARGFRGSMAENAWQHGHDLGRCGELRPRQEILHAAEACVRRARWQRRPRGGDPTVPLTEAGSSPRGCTRPASPTLKWSSHVRRDAPVELPAVAGRLFRVRGHRCALARFRSLRVFALPAGVPIPR